MTGFLLKPFPDELVFSIFSRYYAKSGYLIYRSVAEDLFKNPTNKPSIEFCNLLTEDAINSITSMMSLKDFLLNHTMINYYNTFLPYEKQKAVLNLTLKMNIKELTNLLPLPKSKYKRFLRFCPLCIVSDRENYSETYWHRAHQLYGVTCCHIHGCYLIDSKVPITSEASPVLVTAEEAADNIEAKTTYAEPKEIQISRYANELLNIPYDESFKTPIGNYFHSQLYGTPYLSVRGASRNISLFYRDFLDYYKEVNLLSFDKEWQLQKVFNNQRYNPFELSLIGLFLGISPRDLSYRLSSRATPSLTQFDDTIRKLKHSGLNYRQISDQLNISYDYCKYLVSNRRGKYSYKRSSPSHNMRKPKDYNSLDKRLLPKVKQLVISLQGVDGKRPQRISIGKISRLLNITEYALKRCKSCLSYIQENTETIEKYWAREIVWAYQKIYPDTINKTKLCQLININQYNYSACIPYLKHFADDTIVAHLLRL